MVFSKHEHHLLGLASFLGPRPGDGRVRQGQRQERPHAGNGRALSTPPAKEALRWCQTRATTTTETVMFGGLPLWGR